MRVDAEPFSSLVLIADLLNEAIRLRKGLVNALSVFSSHLAGAVSGTLRGLLGRCARHTRYDLIQLLHLLGNIRQALVVRIGN